VALPDPADQHPDHAATGEFGLLALVTAEAASPAAGPQAIHPRVLSYVVHWHDHPEGWKTGHDEKTAARPLALPADFPTRGLAPVALVLTHDQIARKRAALACHASERRVMGAYLDGFVRATEPYLLWDTGAVRAAVAARAKQRSITPKASLPTAPPASAAPPQAPRRPAGAKDAAPRVELPSS
jgi:LmbE family N-acetylglucosaminyl deacetylase